MSAVAETQISSQLYQVARKAMDYAIEALVAADPLVPFSVMWRDEETTIDRYMHGAYDDSIELAMRIVNRADESVSAYAVVWNGYVQVNGRKRDAVIAEVGSRESPMAVQLAQPYVIEDAGTVRADGQMMAVGESQNLLTTKMTTANLSDHLIKPPYATTQTLVHDVISQPYAQMPVALICLAANLFPGEEAAHVTAGIRKLQQREADPSVAIIHRVFSVLTASVSDGDLMHVLPTDDLAELARLVVDGATQLKASVAKGLVWDQHAKAYFAAVGDVLTAALTNNGGNAVPADGAKLIGLLHKATATE